ncbi:TlpA family protein disulfide reductase [Zhouia sp. PK063]|uniref:TlpA family protein disulfide reductase n=1 Tax=Zhouia sp. PK063 TaxID=3373602 RepID=UPI0037B8CD6D
MKNKLVIVLFLLVSTITFAQKKEFSRDALNEKFIALNGGEVSLKQILKEHKGKTIFIDIWASWCKDCLANMPAVELLKTDYKNVDYISLSLDKSVEAWKKGIEKYNVTGEHYFIQKGWKESAFCTDVSLDWIPRYMVVGPDGKIKLFKAILASDDKLINELKQTTK